MTRPRRLWPSKWPFVAQTPCVETRRHLVSRGNSGVKAGIIDLLSNNSDLGFTPAKLRELAQPGKPKEAPSAVPSYQVHKLSARLSTDQIDEIVRRYGTGESARLLATELGVAPSALLRLLRERNVVVRRQVITPEQKDLMARNYAAGMTVAELKDKHGVSHGAVLRALHRAGVEMRAKAPRKR